MSTKENNSEVAVEKATENNDKVANDVKADVKGTKRPAEVSTFLFFNFSVSLFFILLHDFLC